MSECQPGGNKSSTLECTPTSNRCYKRKVTKIDAEDELHQGCTNEDGCGIYIKTCINSDDCTASCCEKDLCNNKASGIANSARVLIGLVIAVNFGVGLLL